MVELVALAISIAEEGPSQSSMGGEALGPMNVLCPSTGEHQGQKKGNGWVGKWGEGMGDFWDSILNVIGENM